MPMTSFKRWSPSGCGPRTSRPRRLSHDAQSDRAGLWPCGEDLAMPLLPGANSLRKMPAGGYTAPGFEPVRRAFTRIVGRRQGGGALTVRLRGEIVVDLHSGYADRARTRPWTPETLSISFSTTKGVASTVIHRLADRGELRYDEPVASYWPEFAAGGKERVTVRHLLTHRAGLH